MRTLVTGAAGFIGSTLVDRLLLEGHQVVGIDNLATGTVANLEQASRHHGRAGGRFSFLTYDIRATDLAGVVDFAEPDVVFHLAAQVDLRASVADPQHDASCNVLGTINVLEACRRAGVRRIVYAASGGSRYGAPMDLPVKESSDPEPLSPYAAAKFAGEVYLRAYAKMYDISPISLALANVYGPRQNPFGEAGVIAVFGSALLRGRPVTVFGDGTATRDYIYVGDVVDAFVRAAAAPLTTTGTFNIGTGLQTTTNDVYRLLSAVLGGPAPPSYADARPGEVHAIALDATKAGEQLGWRPTVELEQGLRHTTHWLRRALEPQPAALAEV